MNQLQLPFTATAIGLATALGSSTSTKTNTFTTVSDGLLAAASAFSVGAGLSPTGTPKPAASTLADAFATGGNLTISTGMQLSANQGMFAFQAAGAEMSSLNLLGGYSVVNAPLI